MDGTYLVIIVTFTSGLILGIGIGSYLLLERNKRLFVETQRSAQLILESYTKALGMVQTKLELANMAFIEDALKNYKDNLDKINKYGDDCYELGREEYKEEKGG